MVRPTIQRRIQSIRISLTGRPSHLVHLLSMGRFHPWEAVLPLEHKMRPLFILKDLYIQDHLASPTGYLSNGHSTNRCLQTLMLLHNRDHPLYPHTVILLPTPPSLRHQVTVSIITLLCNIIINQSIHPHTHPLMNSYHSITRQAIPTKHKGEIMSHILPRPANNHQLPQNVKRSGQSRIELVPMLKVVRGARNKVDKVLPTPGRTLRQQTMLQKRQQQMSPCKKQRKFESARRSLIASTESIGTQLRIAICALMFFSFYHVC